MQLFRIILLYINIYIFFNSKIFSQFLGKTENEPQKINIARRRGRTPKRIIEENNLTESKPIEIQNENEVEIEMEVQGSSKDGNMAEVKEVIDVSI